MSSKFPSAWHPIRICFRVVSFLCYSSDFNRPESPKMSTFNKRHNILKVFSLLNLMVESQFFSFSNFHYYTLELAVSSNWWPQKPFLEKIKLLYFFLSARKKSFSFPWKSLDLSRFYFLTCSFVIYDKLISVIRRVKSCVCCHLVGGWPSSNHIWWTILSKISGIKL